MPHAEDPHRSDVIATPSPKGSRLAIVCNPRSGRVQKRLHQVRTIGRELAGSLYREANDPGEIAAAVSGLPLSPEETLCIVGGDGTVQAVLTALHAQRPERSWPVLSVAPGGSTNMTARDLGGAGSLIKTLRRLERGHDPRKPTGTLVRRPVLCVDRPNADPVCGMFFGLGSISTGVQFFQENLRGHAYAGEHTSWLSVGRVLLSLALDRAGQPSKAHPTTSAVDGRPPTRHECIACLATTLDRLLFNSRPYWGEEEGPIHFTMVEGEAHGIWRNLLRFARGKPGRQLTPRRGYLSHNASLVKLEFDGSFVVDGELFEVSAADGPLRITAPYAADWLVV